EVGKALRIDIGDGQSSPVNLDVGQQRIAYAFVKATSRGRSVIFQRHILDFAPAVLGHFVQQETVRRRADAQRKAARAWMFLHLGDDLHVIADLSVSHKADDPDVILFVRRGERRANGLHHLGPARSLTRREKTLRPKQVFSRRMDRLRKQNVSVAGEGDQVEGVLWIEIVERQLHRLLRLFNREPFHRTRSVEHEDQFFRRDVCGGHALRRLQYQCKESAPRAAVSHNGVGNLLARDVEFEDEVFVWNCRLILQSHDGAMVVGTGDIYFMQRGFQPTNWDAGVEFDLDRDVVSRARVLWSDHWRDARGVR